MIEVPRLTFAPTQPVNLADVLEAQVRCLIECGVPKEVGVDVAKFKDGAMAMAGEFTFSPELAAIGLDRVCVVHYGVRGRFLMEAGSVTEWTDPDKFGLYDGVTTPEGLRVVQGQFGPKYMNRRPSDIRAQHNPLEELGVPKEGLTAFLYWGKAAPGVLHGLPRCGLRVRLRAVSVPRRRGAGTERPRRRRCRSALRLGLGVARELGTRIGHG
jgi:hypothetical protein